MDIHAPEKPIHSFKDFGIHIAVVTCGILIALALEGVREAIHNHHLVHETRLGIRLEMENNVKNSRDELARVELYRKEMKALVKDAPMLGTQDPDEIAKRLEDVLNPEYFFTATSWQGALSTGVLANMPPDEVEQYAGAAEVISIYTGLQKEEKSQEDRAKAYFAAHPHLKPEDMPEGIERLVLLSRSEDALWYVGAQLKRQMEDALKRSEE